MKLTLEHIAPYLPYGLNGIYTGYGEDDEAQLLGVLFDNNAMVPMVKVSFRDIVDEDVIDHFKPILRPLSDLTVEEVFKFNRISDLPFNRSEPTYSGIKERCIYRIENNELSFRLLDAQMLFKWHIDVFGLIDAELAIDVNKS